MLDATGTPLGTVRDGRRYAEHPPLAGWMTVMKHWTFWRLPPWLAVFVAGLVAADVAAIAYGGTHTVIRIQ